MTNHVPFIDLKAHYVEIAREIEEVVAQVLAEQHFILGPRVEKFEEALADYLGVRYAIGVASGTDALLLSLMALGIGRHDAVITTPFTFIATASAIHHAGARPLFVDIDPRDCTLDPNRLASFLSSMKRNADGRPLTSRGEQVRAIIPVHLYGRCCEMDAIKSIAKRFNLAVVEDAAQALGARSQGRLAGTIGELGGFSFFPTKNLGGFGDGGAITTGDKALADKLRALRAHGATAKHNYHYRGINSRLDALHAAILQVMLGHLDRWTERRRENARRYNEALAGSGLTLPPLGDGDVFNQYSIRTPRRAGLIEHLAQGGIATAIYYPTPIHLQPAYADLGLAPGAFPEAEKASAEVLSLPVFPEMTDGQRDYVIDRVLSFEGR